MRWVGHRWLSKYPKATKVTRVVRLQRSWPTVGTHRKTVESQFNLTWRHNVTSPQVMAVYKVIVTKASLDQYQRYLSVTHCCVRLINPLSPLVVGIAWKLGEISQPWASRAVTRTVDGMEREGSVTSGKRGRQTSAMTWDARFVASLSHPSTLSIARRQPVGEGSGTGSIHRQLRQSSFLLSRTTCCQICA